MSETNQNIAAIEMRDVNVAAMRDRLQSWSRT